MKKILFIGAVDPYSVAETRLQPLWPAYLAAYLEMKFGGGTLEYKFTNSNVEQEIRQFKPDIVAMSSISKNFDFTIEHAKIAKQFNLPVIIGGMHITILPETLTKDMDVAVMGEGEETFYELVQVYLDKGDLIPVDLETINGVAYWQDGQLCKTPRRKPMQPLDECPHPKRDLIGYGRRDYIYSTRGCAYKCVFCSCTHHWGTVRYTSPEYVIEEIRELIDHGVKIIRINDENFASNQKRLKKISELVVKNGFHRKVRFSCWCRSNDVNPEIVNALKKMNIVSVKMGLESGCERTLRYLKGSISVKDNWNAVNLLKDAGIQVNGDFIIGAPEETFEEIMQTYNFIKNSRVDFVDVNVLTPLPGTPIWDYAVKKGIVAENMDWCGLNFKFLENPDKCPVLSETLTREEILKIYKKFQRLRYYKTIKAIPHSPWFWELPFLALKMLAGKTAKAVNKLIPIAQRSR